MDPIDALEHDPIRIPQHVSTPADARVATATEWWTRYPARDVALAQLRQPFLCMPFGEFHRVVEEAVGGPVWTHEFARPEALIAWIEQNDTRPVHPLRLLADAMVRHTGRMWTVRGRRYRSKRLAVRSMLRRGEIVAVAM